MKSFPILIAPSLLASDFARVGEETERAEKSGGDWLHLDIMDGHFVDNISFGPAFVQAVKRFATIPLDVHLMVSRPDHYFPRFLDAADSITVHVESEHDVSKTLGAIRAAGKKAGLSLSPPTTFAKVEPFLSQIDLLLVMTVNPGFGGQEFLAETMEKVREARLIRDRDGLDFHIQVDGGITLQTAPLAIEAGANVLVAGTSLFKATDMASAIIQMRSGKQP